MTKMKLAFLAFGFLFLATWVAGYKDAPTIVGPLPYTYGFNDTIIVACENTQNISDPVYSWYVLIQAEEYGSFQNIKLEESEKVIEVWLFKKFNRMILNCFINNTNHTVPKGDKNYGKYEVKVGEKPTLEYFGRIVTDVHRVTCFMSATSNFSLRMFFRDHLVMESVSSNRHEKRLTWTHSLFEASALEGKIECVGENRFGITKRSLYLMREKGTVGSYCKLDNDCHTENSYCRFHKCTCEKNSMIKRTGNKEVCIEVRALHDYCGKMSQCQHSDKNAICHQGTCQCSKFHEEVNGKCRNKLQIGDVCNSSYECQKSDLYSECRYSGRIKYCFCQDGYIYSHGRCASIRPFQNNTVLKIVVSSVFATVLLVSFLVIFILLIRSIRQMMYQRKSQNYRKVVSQNQNLSLSNKIPIKNPPAPDLSMSEKRNDEPHSPVELCVPDLKEETTNSVNSNEDPSIVVPESIPFIGKTHNSIC